MGGMSILYLKKNTEWGIMLSSIKNKIFDIYKYSTGIIIIMVLYKDCRYGMYTYEIPKNHKEYRMRYYLWEV